MGRPPHRKAALEDSALHLFVEKGVDGASIRDIASRAGVTEGALYRHYDSKEGLVRALFLQHFHAFAERLRAARAGEETASLRVRAMIASFYKLYDTEPAVFEFILMTRHAILDGVRTGPDNPVDVAAEVIADGMKRGEWPKQDLMLATELCMGLVMEIPVAKRYGRITGKSSAYVDEAWSAALAVLRRHEGKAAAKGKK